MRPEVRIRWQAILARELVVVDGDGAEHADTDPVASGAMFAGVEERDSFEKLGSCVLGHLDHLEVNDRTRGYLHRLWQFLWLAAQEGGDINAATVLSQRKLARHLSIPRDRLPALYSSIGQLVESCRASQSVDHEEDSPPKG